MVGYPWILNWLEEESMSQVDLGRAIDLDPPKVHRSIYGIRKFSPIELAKAAKFFRCTLDEIHNGKRSKNTYLLDEDLMRQTIEASLSFLETSEEKLTHAEIAYGVQELYRMAINYRENGKEILPNEAISELIFRKRRSFTT